MYGVDFKGSVLGVSPVYKGGFVGNATAAARDFANLESGKLELCSAGDEITGILMMAMTNTSTDVMLNITPGMIVVMDNDNVGTTFAVTHVGARFDITGATGAMLVDTSTASATAGSLSGQLACEAYSPNDVGYDGDASIGRFRVIERTFGI